jgi:hypothetical protein
MSIFPGESQIDEPNIIRSRVKSRAAPGFAQWVWDIGLGDTGNEAMIVFHVPGYAAIWAAERAEVDKGVTRVLSPDGGVPAQVIGLVGITGDETAVIDAVSAA